MAVTAAAVNVYAYSPPPPEDARGRRIDRAIAAGRTFLIHKITQDGSCEGEYPRDHRNHLFGGKTALTVYALLTAGMEVKTPRVARALNWLHDAELDGTYAVALRASAYAALKGRRARQLLASDVQWLIKAASRQGAYSYGSLARQTGEVYDNSNSQMAVLGVWAGASRGLEIPRVYWKLVERHWLDQQQIDGAWGYITLPTGRKTKTYGSMTAAGLATLYICFDNLRREQFIRCRASAEYKPIDAALEWLGRNFTVVENPRHSQWYFYWLYALERVGLASGHKYFGGHDWYAEGAAELLRRQLADGSWGYGDRVADTAFALLFLARGRQAVLVNKLRYPGRWNARPRDMANLTRYVSYDFERPVSWQIVEIDSPAQDWHDAPILYVSGAGPIELTDKQTASLRDFVLQGGTIVSEAACNNGDFTLDMRKIYKKVFPDYPLERLGDDHPIYSIHFDATGLTGLAGVSNGVRLLAIHSPRELSLGLQLGPSRQHRPWFELLTNIYLYVTDKGILRPRGTGIWPRATMFEPAAHIRLARLKYAGNFNPEPMGWQRLATIVGNRHRIKLTVTEPMKITSLKAAEYPIAHMTGTEGFTLTDSQRQSLAKFLAAGGTLIADAAGGSKAFSDSVVEQIFPLVARGIRGPVATTVLYEGPEKIEKVSYRRDYAMALGKAKHEPRIIGVLSAGRLAVVFSPDDMTAALVGYPCYGIRGYTPQSAVALMTNILCHTADVKLPNSAD